jgi:hypothetical protein
MLKVMIDEEIKNPIPSSEIGNPLKCPVSSLGLSWTYISYTIVIFIMISNFAKTFELDPNKFAPRCSFAPRSQKFKFTFRIWSLIL